MVYSYNEILYSNENKLYQKYGWISQISCGANEARNEEYNSVCVSAIQE